MKPETASARVRWTVLWGAAFLLLVFGVGAVQALTVSIEPQKMQRAVNGKARVMIYANDASALISMGVRVSFDPAILQADAATTNKYTAFSDGWVMDADGDALTEDDRYVTPAVEIDNTGGSVTMIGGRVIGTATTGLSGKVLLGWIDFTAVGNGTANLTVDLAKYHPNDPTDKFDNFVNLDGTVDEPVNKGTDAGWIYVGDDACEPDINSDGRVNVSDLLVMKGEFGRIDCNDPGQSCTADINGDGRVNVSDLLIMKGEFGRIDCPVP